MCAMALGAGVFGVEMFLLADGNILLNEIAPRPHNSGHYTIEACATSQYEQHLRAILGWPLGDTSLVVGSRSVDTDKYFNTTSQDLCKCQSW